MFLAALSSFFFFLEITNLGRWSLQSLSWGPVRIVQALCGPNAIQLPLQPPVTSAKDPLNLVPLLVVIRRFSPLLVTPGEVTVGHVNVPQQRMALDLSDEIAYLTVPASVIARWVLFRAAHGCGELTRLLSHPPPATPAQDVIQAMHFLLEIE